MTLDGSDQNESIKWALFFKNVLHKIYTKIKNEKNGTKKVLKTLKSGINSIFNILSSDKDDTGFFDLIPETKIIKMYINYFNCYIGFSKFLKVN